MASDRLFTNKQKKALLLQHEFCPSCGGPLDIMEADHIKPYSKGGKTQMENGQALCRECNRKKGSKNMIERKKPRGWQTKAFEELKIKYIEQDQKSFMLVAGVGSGKTFFSSYVFDYFKREGIFDSVLIISPSDNIKYNWAVTFQTDFNIKIEHEYNFRNQWPRDCHGVSNTFHSLNETNAMILQRYVNKRTLLIVDEVHHAGDSKSWGEGIKILGEKAGKILLLSGTPDRSDNNPIPFVIYHEVSENYFELEYDFYYSYEQSVKDGVCCPVIFPEQKGKAKTTFGELQTLSTSEDDEEEQKRIFRKIIKVGDSKDCYTYKMFENANAKLDEINEGLVDEPYKKGLIVCDQKSDANNMYKLLYDEYGPDFVDIVTSDDPDSSKKINDFNYNDKVWLVSVKQVSEGVDIPRLRVLVYASPILTMLFFLQVMGRIIRNPKHIYYNGKVLKRDVAYMYVPQFAPLIRNAQRVIDELKHQYELIEKEEEEFERMGSGAYAGQTSIFDEFDFIESDTIQDGAVYNDQRFNANQDDEAERISKEIQTSKDLVFEVMKRIDQSDVMQAQAPQERVKTQTEKKNDIKKQIAKLVNKIAHRRNGGEYPPPAVISATHVMLNKQCGIFKTSDATLTQLEHKLEISRNYLNSNYGN